MLTTVAATAAAFLALAPAAQAELPSSSADVNPTTLLPGQTFTVSETIHNTRDFTVTYAKAAIYDSVAPLTDVVDLVSCTGVTDIGCFQAGSSYRAPFGDLEAGGTRTAVFTLRVKDTAAPGSFTLRHQFVGDNYAFDILDGPVVTIAPSQADVKVALAASGHGGLSARIDYTLTVTNAGPADATGIRVVATYPSGLSFGSATGCGPGGTGRTLNCDVASLSSGSSATATFSLNGGLLALGSYTTTVQRTASAPTDPNSANDSAAKTCSALTGLVVTC